MLWLFGIGVFFHRVVGSVPGFVRPSSRTQDGIITFNVEMKRDDDRYFWSLWLGLLEELSCLLYYLVDVAYEEIVTITHWKARK